MVFYRLNNVKNMAQKYANKAKVIIVSGSPCAGKTTLSEKISNFFKLPIISCDPIREYLYDTLGCFNLSMFRKNRKISFGLMFFIIEILLKSSQSFIIDSSFKLSRNRKKIQKLQEKYRFKCFQVNLRAKGETLWSRYLERIMSGRRHAGYLYHLRLNRIKRQAKKGFTAPPKLKGSLLKIDTSDFKKVNFKKIFNKLKVFLATS